MVGLEFVFQCPVSLPYLLEYTGLNLSQILQEQDPAARTLDQTLDPPCQNAKEKNLTEPTQYWAQYLTK